MFEYFYADMGFFILRIALGLIFVLYGIRKISKPKERKKYFGPKYSWLVFLVGMTKLVCGSMLLIGAWVSISGFILAGLTFIVLFFHIFVWRDKFLGGWDIELLLFASALFFALAGGGNWVLII